MMFRIVDTVSGAHFSLKFNTMPQIGEKVKLNDLITLTVIEFSMPNSLVVTSNGSFDEVMRAING